MNYSIAKSSFRNQTGRTVKIKTFPRIHITLVDLAGATRRRFGGAGFSLNAMPATVTARIASKNNLSAKSHILTRDYREFSDFLTLLSTTMNVNFNLQITSAMPQHVGLGSKTAILLAMALACNSLIEKPLPSSDLVSMTGRGGASGIGTNVAFLGGFVVDAGHPLDGSSDFVPSSAFRPRTIPPWSVRLTFPSDWLVHLLLPTGRFYFGVEERRFFEENTPIPQSEVFSIMAAIYHGLVPAIAEGNFGEFRTSLKDIHHTGFKQREVKGQSPVVQALLDDLHNDPSLAVGMRSIGPLVYAVQESPHHIRSKPALLGSRASKIEYLGCVSVRNSGYQIVRL